MYPTRGILYCAHELLFMEQYNKANFWYIQNPHIPRLPLSLHRLTTVLLVASTLVMSALSPDGPTFLLYHLFLELLRRFVNQYCSLVAF